MLVSEDWPGTVFQFMFFDALCPLYLKDFRAFYVFWPVCVALSAFSFCLLRRPVHAGLRGGVWKRPIDAGSKGVCRQRIGTPPIRRDTHTDTQRAFRQMQGLP